LGKGWVVLVVPKNQKLDVVAAYSAAPSTCTTATCTASPALDLQEILPKQVQTIDPAVLGTP